MVSMIQRFLEWFKAGKQGDMAAFEPPRELSVAPSDDPVAEWIAKQDAEDGDFVVEDIQLPPTAAVHFSKPAK